MRESRQEIAQYFRDDILEIARKNDWKGEGEEDNPFICSSLVGFLEEFRIEGVGVYIIFDNCKFKRIGLIESNNLMFKNCEFKELGLQRSKEISFISCSIDSLILWGLSSSSFKECKITLIRNFSSYGNIFEKCSLNANNSILFKEAINVRPIGRIFALLGVIFGITFISSVFALVISNRIDFLLFFGQLVATISLFGFALYFRYYSKKMEKRPPNVIIT